jgi:hypothetical protein
VLECPAGLVPLGGGVANPLFGPQSINSSLPTSTGWSAAVSNPGPSSSFEVIFTCGMRPKRYSLARSASVLVGPGETRSAVATCPARSDVLGGGGFSDSGLTQVSTAPATDGWDTDLRYVAAAGDPTVLWQPFVVCAGR